MVEESTIGGKFIARDKAAVGAVEVDQRRALAGADGPHVADALDSGDHTIFIGQVQAVGAVDGAPLVYFDGAYRRLVTS